MSQFFNQAFGFLNQLPDISTPGYRIGGVITVLQGVLVALGSARRFPAMHPAPPVGHSWGLAGFTRPLGLRPAPGAFMHR
jgi:hypothetical protein